MLLITIDNTKTPMNLLEYTVRIIDLEMEYDIKNVYVSQYKRKGIEIDGITKIGQSGIFQM